MAKLPDFSELTKKFDIQGLVDSVKSAVGGSGSPPKAPEGDEVSAKFVEIITLTQNLANTQAEQGKVITAVHNKLNSLYKDLQLLKEATAVTGTVVETKVVDSTPAEQDSPTKEENK